jgi:hypothetical protein
MAGERDSAARTRLVSAAAALAAAYLAWRAGFTLAAASPAAVLFLAAEAAGLGLALAACAAIARADGPPRLEPGAAPPDLDVDVLVLAGDAGAARRTAVLARALAHPHHTWICDPARRPALEALARELEIGYASGLAGDAPLALVLQAGDLPRRALLGRVLPLFADPRTALVQVARVPLGAAPERMGRRIACGAAPLLGSGAVFRRAAPARPRAAFLDEALLFAGRRAQSPLALPSVGLARRLAHALLVLAPFAALPPLALALSVLAGRSPLRPTPAILAAVAAAHLALEVALPRLLGAPSFYGALAARALARRRAPETFPVDLPSAVAAAEGSHVTLVLVRRLGRARASVLSHERLAAGARVFLDLSPCAIARPVRALVRGSAPSADSRHPGILHELDLEGLSPAEEDAIDRVLVEVGIPRLVAARRGAPPGPPPEAPAPAPAGTRVIFDTMSGFIHVKSSILARPGSPPSAPPS